MYRKLFAVLAVLVVVSLTTSSAALAMPGLPFDPTPVPVQKHENAYPQHATTPATTRVASVSSDAMVYAEAIAFGKPMAFRYDKTFGVTEEAYFDDTNHLNGATGLMVDAGGNVYMVEENGARLLKFAPNKTLIWQTGITGMHDWGMSGLNWPREVALGPDGKIWVADNDGVARFEPTDGAYLGRFPAQPWMVGDEARFNELRGLAFDSDGRLYVSDRWRHRIQVFDTDDDTPEYIATIGVTDEWGNDQAHFNEPGQIVVDSENNLYVADIQNARVQKCEPNVTFSAWVCETYTGTGNPGGEDDEFAFVYGLGISADDTLYISDNANGRVKKCYEDAISGVVCSILVSNLYWPTEVAPDPVTGNLYISIYDDYIVNEYTAAGAFVRQFAGVQGVPYLTDDHHLNGPRAVETDSKGNVFVAEEWGQRLLKLSPIGDALWTKGMPGKGTFDLPDPNLISSPTALALDPSGKLLAVVQSGWSISLYDAATGNYLRTISRDEDHYRFDYAQGITYDRSGNLYISDRNAQIVNVYNKSGIFVRQIGVRYERSADNQHFNNPTGLATDSSGNLFVADHDNCRVQKFDKYGRFVMTFGTARCGRQYDRMGGPADVAVDSKGNVYVSEEWNSRVSVYSSKGVYQGYIGGEWSGNSGGLRNPTSVAVDKKGNVYVADMNNARVQRYAPGVPYAAKVSQDNFGGRDYTSVWALGLFKGQLYAGTTNAGPGAQIWRQTKTGWEAVITDGFEDGGNRAIDHLYEYKGYLYASTYHCTNEECTTTNGGQLWRSPDGLTWQPVTWDGFGNRDNIEIFRMAKLGAKLCAVTLSLNEQSELWCSESGEPDSWARQLEPGFGETGKLNIFSLQEYNGAFFAGGQGETGAVVFRKTPTTEWEKITFPQGTNANVTDLAVYKTYLYAITNTTPGNTAQVLRCQVCDGNDWLPVTVGFGGNLSNRIMPAIEATKSILYIVTGNRVDGLSVWKSSDGVKWAQAGPYGLGSSNTAMVYWGNSVVASGSNLYLGTIANTSGGAVWKICSSSSCK